MRYIPLVLIIACTSLCAYSQTMGSPPAQSSGRQLTIDSCVNEFSMARIESTKVGYQQKKEFFFVLEGRAEFSLAGETRVAGPYTSFYCPSNVLHGIRNVGDKELKYLVIKKYQTD